MDRRPCKSSRISILQPQQLLSHCDAEIAQEIELVTVDILIQVCDCFVRQGAVRWEDFNNGLDMSYLSCDLDRVNSKLDREYAAQADDHL